MIPVVTPAEMGAIDRAAPEPVEVLVGRAGGAVARAALELLGGAYGRRVVVLAGKGNNGADGREAARRLRARGAAVTVVDALDAPPRLGSCDLVVDAAFGTGFRGTYRAPELDGDPLVLAVDIPSGVDGLTGAVAERVLAADRTVTFAALKPGLLLPPGAQLTGTIEVADIGLDTSGARAQLVGDADVASWYPRRPADAHKWQAAVWVIGGSPGLEGAAALVAGAALRAGAGYVRWSAPGGVPAIAKPLEVVTTALPEVGWAQAVLAEQHRFASIVVGNGLGVDPSTGTELRQLVSGRRCRSWSTPTLSPCWVTGWRRWSVRGPCSPPTTVSSPAWPERRRGPTGSPPCGSWPRAQGRSCCSRVPARSWPSRPVGCSRARAGTPASPPWVRATCSPGWSAHSAPVAWTRSGRPRSGRSCTVAPAT